MATPERSSTLSTSEQLSDEQLQAAGLFNVPSKVLEWIPANDMARGEVTRLAELGAGAIIRDNPEAQAAVMEAFVEAAVFAKLRETDNVPDLPVKIDAIIRDFLPQDLQVSDDISELDEATPTNGKAVDKPLFDDSLPEKKAGSALRPMASKLVSNVTGVVGSRKEDDTADTVEPKSPVAAESAKKHSTELFDTAHKTEKNEKKDKKNKYRLIKGIGALALVGIGFFAANSSHDTDHASGPEKNDRQTSQSSADIAPAPNLQTPEQRQDFFADAVNVYDLPGRIGNNFGPALSADETRIDTPEMKQKTIDTFGQMLKGNVDIMVTYMYTFNMTGPQIDGGNAGARIQQLKDLAAHLKDPANVNERYDDYQKVMNVVRSMNGGDLNHTGPTHISWYETPGGLGLDNHVQENGVPYRLMSFTLPDGSTKQVNILLDCHLQPMTEEIQQVPQQVLISQQPVVEQPVVEAAPVEQIPIETGVPIESIPYGWNQQWGGEEWYHHHHEHEHPTPPQHLQPKQTPQVFANNQNLNQQGSGTLENKPAPVQTSTTVNKVPEQSHASGGAATNRSSGIQTPNAAPHVSKPVTPHVSGGSSVSGVKIGKH